MAPARPATATRSPWRGASATTAPGSSVSTHTFPGILDQHARGDEQQRERRIVAAAVLGPAPAGKDREREVGGQRQVGVARERDVRVQNRQRHHQPRADQRPQRIEAALREEAVDRQRERHAGQPPGEIDERVVPAPQHRRAPCLQQRHGAGIVRVGVGVGGAPGLEPFGRRDERDHRFQLEPDARLGGPMRPRVPWEQRPRHGFGEQQRRSGRRATRAVRARPRARSRPGPRPRERATRRARIGRSARRSRRQTSQHANAAIAASGTPMVTTPKGTPAADSARIQSVSRNAPANHPQPSVHASVPEPSRAAVPRGIARMSADAEDPGHRKAANEREDIHADVSGPGTMRRRAR